MDLLIITALVGLSILLLLSIVALLVFFGALVAILAGAGMLVVFVGRVLLPRPEPWELSTKN
jgi:hypothetical protein